MEGDVGYRSYITGGFPTNAASVTSPVVRSSGITYEPASSMGAYLSPPLRGGPYSVDTSTVSQPDAFSRLQERRPYRSAIIPPAPIGDNNNLFTGQYALGQYTQIVDTQYASGGRLLFTLKDPVTRNSRLQFGSARGGQHRITR